MGKQSCNSPVTNVAQEEKLLDSGRRTSVLVIKSSQMSIPSTPFQPPDGGWGWFVCFASFLTNGIIFGTVNSFGVIIEKLKEVYCDINDVTFVTAIVGSLCVGMTFLLSPVASILTDKFGIRKTAFLGGLIATVGMLSSSFVTTLEHLYITYGIMLGSGASLAYTPSLVILGHYFRRRLGIVNGIVTAGSSVFTMVMPPLLRYLLDTVDLAATLQILAAMMGTLMLCALTFRPLYAQHQRISEGYKPASEESLPREGCSSICSSVIDTSIWKIAKYRIWVFAVPSALFGYFVPYVHLVGYVKNILPNANGEFLVTCIGLTSGVGRIVFGKLADFPSVNRIFLQQVAFLSIGCLTMVIVVSRHFAALVVICLFLGLFDGCFISLLGPIAFDIVGHKGASQAIGFLLGFCSIPLTVGPPMAGWLYDQMKNYDAAFLAAGVPPIIGAAVLCLMHRNGRKQTSNNNLESSERHPLESSGTPQVFSQQVLSEKKSLTENDLIISEKNISIDIPN